jgi:hypothetical protein
VFLIVSLAFLPCKAFADEPSVPATQAQSLPPDQPPDLTLSNFFTEGWDQAWTHRVTPGGAPDMALLHVQTNFLEREFRFDYYNQDNLATDSTRSINFMDALVAYGINRRFMLEVVTNYEWKDVYTPGANISGAGGALVARLQLVGVPGCSYSFNFRVSAPNEGIGVQQTTLSYAIAGWQDLSMLGLDRIGLNRVGLYYHIQEETYVGPAAAGSKRNDLTYAVSLAKTWTDPDVPFIGNLTTFVEVCATTNLDGWDKGHTDLNITPGVRLTLGHGHVLIAGIDLPLSNPHEFHFAPRLTYIYNFH